VVRHDEVGGRALEAMIKVGGWKPTDHQGGVGVSHVTGAPESAAWGKGPRDCMGRGMLRCYVQTDEQMRSSAITETSRWPLVAG
jgi:hypothetical protein